MATPLKTSGIPANSALQDWINVMVPVSDNGKTIITNTNQIPDPYLNSAYQAILFLKLEMRRSDPESILGIRNLVVKAERFSGITKKKHKGKKLSSYVSFSLACFFQKSFGKLQLQRS